ncbi:hypothetical protein BC827DRAFT_1267362 [Russula dissimulans]|nr:hypothetical protein BC827DRAFT_1267362 [Russula dissimulans]
MRSSYVAFLLLAASAAAPALAAPTPEKVVRFDGIPLGSKGARAPMAVWDLDLAGAAKLPSGHSEDAEIVVRGIIDFLNEDSVQETLTRNAGAGSERAQILNSRVNRCLDDPTECSGQT